VLTKEERRAAHAVFSRVPAQFYFRTTDVDRGHEVGGGRGDVMPGDKRELRSDIDHAGTAGKGLAVRDSAKAATPSRRRVTRDYRVGFPAAKRRTQQEKGIRLCREIITLQCGDCKNRNYHNDEKQEEAYRADGNKEVLKIRCRQANGAQGV